jgi:hypothetical protein
MSARKDILASIRANRPEMIRTVPDVPRSTPIGPRRSCPRSRRASNAWAVCSSIRRPPAIFWRRRV